MGKIKEEYKIKLLCGVLFNPEWVMNNFNISDTFSAIKKINSIIEENFRRFGIEKIDLLSEVIDFNLSDYYEEEMGTKILRYWISFFPNIQAKNLYKIKIFTNELEEKYFSDINRNRKVNIDPGYIDGSKLVLFSTKNYSHRIYLDEGIFAEVTLIYKNKQFQILSWTYPDYKLDVAIDFFKKVRDAFLKL